jgi:ATP-binding cassette subfamily B (MDR/TAP) protein 1
LKSVPFLKLFRFATKADIILIVIGSIAALAMGAAMPIFALLWGSMTDAFAKGGDEMVDAARTVMFIFFGIGAAAFLSGWLMFACWMIAGERQAIACRKAYLRSLLRQEIGWFDMINQS